MTEGVTWQVDAHTGDAVIIVTPPQGLGDQTVMTIEDAERVASEMDGATIQPKPVVLISALRKAITAAKAAQDALFRN